MNKFLALLILLSLIFVNCLFATDEIENKLILEIDISGNINIDDALVRSLISFAVGDFLDKEDVSKTITNLYQLGVLDDIFIETEDLEHGILVKVNIKEFPVVKSVGFEGNSKIKTSKIEEVINLKSGSYWSPFLSSEVSKKISNLYNT